ncbi:MAG: glycosyltransferase family 2 protein [Vicinamibacterales bacterium]
MTLSVVIPNWNQSRYLAGAIDSLLAQTRPPDEILVVDDGSTDGCDRVVAGRGDRVRLLRQDRGGLAAARNAGILAARGAFVGLLDADDRWSPAFVEAWQASRAAHPDATVYYCGAQAIDDDERPLPQRFGGPPVPSDRLRARLLRANFLIPSTIVLRRAAVIEAGLFDTGFRSAQGCEDWDLWLRLLPRHEFAGLEACHARYRVHPAAMSADPAGMQRSARRVMEKQFGPDDGRWAGWSAEQRRGWGGFYRYALLSSIQRRDDWAAAPDHLHRAIAIDPDLASDLDLFYDLALGAQPAGHRGTATGLDLDANAARIGTLVADVAARPGAGPWRRALRATACRALGLAAYNTRHYRASRRFLASAVYYQPRLLGNQLVAGDLVKSFLRGGL